MATSDNALLIVVAVLPCSKFKGHLFWKVFVSVLLVFDRNKSNCDLSETQYYNIMSGGCFKKLHLGLVCYWLDVLFLLIDITNN